ncbi:MAG: NAD-dependent epimerase/dehydratase family protein [Candidatus Omnitrophica bacterium]|nr:NAD-dependent epimerase/dehydratase family protein [Candidatus Omnitrophota bacterium]
MMQAHLSDDRLQESPSVYPKENRSNSEADVLSDFNLFFSGKKILVTGASGYIAHTLIERLSHFKCELYLSSQHPDQITPPPLNLGLLKFMSLSSDFSLHTFQNIVPELDIIFHLSAQTNLTCSFQNPGQDFIANVLPLVHILEAAKRRQKPLAVILASTVTIFGIPNKIPVNESCPDHPMTFYCFHKKLAEDYLKSYTDGSWVTGASLRLPNIYGPGPKSSNTERGVLNQMIRKSIQGHPLTIYGEGREIRDYLYIEDAVDAFLYSALNHTRLVGKPYVIGSGHGSSISQSISLVAERVGSYLSRNISIEHIDHPENNYAINERNFVADAQLFASLTGWKARTSLSDGIAQTLKSYLI